MASDETMNALFFDEDSIGTMTEEVNGEDLRVGDTVIMLFSDLNIIHHFKEYNGPLPFVNRIAKFTNGRGCSISNGKYKILRRM